VYYVVSIDAVKMRWLKLDILYWVVLSIIIRVENFIKQRKTNLQKTSSINFSEPIGVIISELHS